MVTEAESIQGLLTPIGEPRTPPPMAPARGPPESQEDLDQTPRYDSQPSTAGARTAEPSEQQDREAAERQGCRRPIQRWMLHVAGPRGNGQGTRSGGATRTLPASAGSTFPRPCLGSEVHGEGKGEDPSLRSEVRGESTRMCSSLRGEECGEACGNTRWI